MSEYIPKNDQYIISLNELLITNNPKSIKDVEDLLDDNGYYGRNKVYPINIKTPKETSYFKKNQAIRIQIYLVDSKVHYTWPYDTYYDIANKSFGKRRKPGVIRDDFRLAKCMYFFATTGCMITGNLDKVAELGSLMMGWANKSEYKKMITFLCQADLFHNGEFRLKSHIDVYEYKNNMFDYNYFIL
jgi:hypothetical protein